MNKLHLFSLCFCLLALAACGSDDEPVPTTPVYLQQGGDVRPTSWQAPDYSLFELTMSVQVQLGDTLAHYQSEQDLMCAKVDNEVRAVTGPRTTMNVVYFPLTIAGNGSERTITLQYYCDRLHRIFTIPDWTNFDAAAAPTGDDGLYRPRFTEAMK
ncbi:MAG: hypothetical protein J6N92_04675 [Alloprevotella sp.]|nr:hypothetical protein [Alloprevotella sp.]